MKIHGWKREMMKICFFFTFQIKTNVNLWLLKYQKDNKKKKYKKITLHLWVVTYDNKKLFNICSPHIYFVTNTKLVSLKIFIAEKESIPSYIIYMCYLIWWKRVRKYFFVYKHFKEMSYKNYIIFSLEKNA